MYHKEWTFTSTSRSTDIHNNPQPDWSTYLTTDRVTQDNIGNLQKKIVITFKLGFELVGIYRALFFLVQDLQFALRRAGQNPTDVEVALCQLLEKGKIWNKKMSNLINQALYIWIPGSWHDQQNRRWLWCPRLWRLPHSEQRFWATCSSYISDQMMLTFLRWLGKRIMSTTLKFTTKIHSRPLAKIKMVTSSSI